MKFEVNGKNYDLEYTVNAMAALEEKTGKGIGDITALGEFSSLRSLFWAGLINKHKNITLTDAGDIVQQFINDGNTFEDLSKMVTEALRQAGFFQDQAATKRTK